MKAIIARSRNSKTGLSPSQSGYSKTEDIIAIVSAIPSSIVIYTSIHHDLFPSSRGIVTLVLAIAFGSTIALTEAL